MTDIYRDEGRRRIDRRRRRVNRVGAPNFEFVNPYPWMSSIEAMVHLELERRNVPFSWRYFDSKDLSPHIAHLMPDFAPEFTLREYKTAILIIGAFFGDLPGVIDKNALAIACLEADGWKAVTFFEAEIRAGVRDLIDRRIPALVSPHVRGQPKPNPYGYPDYMERRRRYIAGLGLLKKKFKLDKQEEPDDRRRNRRRLRRLRGGSDGNRGRFA